MQTLQQLQSGELIGTKRLTLSCGLTEFPKAIYNLAETLEVLDLSNNSLSTLPHDFIRFVKLKILFLSNNQFTIFPEVLGLCQSLTMIGFKSNQITYISEKALPTTTRWLILTNNRLQALPKSIGNCLPMQKLALAGNQLQTLPEELANCKNLGLLRISANQLQALPTWLLAMPKLSWLAFSGNPFSKKSHNTVPLQTISWQQLSLTNQLGEGASGIISKAIWQKENGVEEAVAVKVFKGSVTSDGYPEDEMDACILAGNHPNLVTVLGKITNHPLRQQGLVLGLIPPIFRNLGLPPSFDTCTRDVFLPGTAFSIQKVVAIVLSIASAAAHLHSCGIMHGDLYAHNTLVDIEANTLFGDFGAASLYDVTEPNTATALQQIEVSAFGCLLQDLLAHTMFNEEHHTAMDVLTTLQQACLQPTVLNRPNFVSIIEILKGIKI
ncbi:MAG: serine/threonine-protein kinase [Pedobacter sp.]|nr:serine/threonine-protein kinase [Chitinophagaceae bacterium]